MTDAADTRATVAGPVAAPVPASDRRGWRLGFGAGIATIVLGMLLLAALQYFMPPSVHYRGPINPGGARLTAQWFFGHALTPLSIDAFIWTFRALVAAVWIGYAVVIVSALRLEKLPTAWVLAVAGVLATALAVVFPPTLTHDLYAYLALGRMSALHGWNPYTHTLLELARLGDDAAVHYPVAAPSVYGPFWTLLSSGLAWALRPLALPAQLIGLKLVEVAALVLAGFSARAIARIWDPAHADLALVAVVLNPLLLLEGPANGHNDVLMAALLLAGIALVLRSSWLGWPVIGLSVGVKFVTLAIVPWLIYRQVRSMRLSRAVTHAAAAIALVVAPLALFFVPYWKGSGTLGGIPAVWSAKAAGHSGAGIGVIISGLVFLAASYWVWRGREDDRVAPAWTVWALSFALLAMPIVLPWYLSWASALTFTRWDRRQRWLTAGCIVAAIAYTLRYSMLRFI